jgi:hypothetical protein
MDKHKWVRSNTGHHYAGYKLRVITATIDGKGPMYWLYGSRGGHGRRHWDGELDENGRQKPYDFGPPVRDLRKAKRLVEKLVASEQEGE